MPSNPAGVFTESIAANPDIALVDLEAVDLSPYVDVLGVVDELRARTSATLNGAAASEVCKGWNKIVYRRGCASCLFVLDVQA
jgi:hypothetical protein